jgi:hypothetical protein
MYEVRVSRNPQFDRIFFLMEPEDTQGAKRHQTEAPQYKSPGVTANGEAKPATILSNS